MVRIRTFDWYLLSLCGTDDVTHFEMLFHPISMNLRNFIGLKRNNNRVKDWVYAKFHMVQQESANILSDGLPMNKMHGVFAKRSMSRSQSGYSKSSEDFV